MSIFFFVRIVQTNNLLCFIYLFQNSEFEYL